MMFCKTLNVKAGVEYRGVVQFPAESIEVWMQYGEGLVEDLYWGVETFNHPLKAGTVFGFRGVKPGRILIAARAASGFPLHFGEE